MNSVQTNKTINHKVNKNLSMSLLIVAIITLAVVFGSAIGIAIAAFIQGYTQGQVPIDSPIYTATRAVSIVATILIVASLVLSIVLFVLLQKDKQMKKIYMATCIINWIFALFILVTSILNVSVVMGGSVTLAFGYINSAFLIALVVLDAISYGSLNKEHKANK